MSLIEVLVALVILIIGIFALVQLQATSMRSTALARAINETTRFVKGELDRQKQTVMSPIVGGSCTEPLPDGIQSCELTVQPCYLTASSLTCATTGVFPSAFRISVAAVGPLDQELTLSALWTGTFIAGEAGGISGVVP